MKHHSLKGAIAAAATAALLGTAAPAAVAAPHADRPAHATKADRETAKVDRAAAKEAKAVARVSRALDRLLDRNKLTKLGDVNEEAVRAKIAADRDTPDAGMRPHVYQQVINQLRFAERLLVAAEGNGDATTAITATVGTLVGFTATTPKAELRVTKRELQVWAALLEDETEAEAPEETELEDGTDTSTQTPPEEPAADI